MTKKALIIENQKLLAEKEALKHRLYQLEKMIFGSRSERVKTIDYPDQLELFAEINDQEESLEEQTEQITYTRTKSKSKHSGRNAFPEYLPVKEEVIEPNCDTTGMTKISEQITQTLEYTPANLYIKRIIRPVYADKVSDKIISAELPSRPLPKAIAEASLLTHIMISKFIDHLPFYRQIKIYKRDFDWVVSSSTIND